MKPEKRDYSIHDVQVSLDRKKATVTLRDDFGSMVFVNSFPFDPPGEQTESQLRSLALSEAREILKRASQAI
ncbi:MAG TPA: hypothetical protein DDZ68_13115 [Parvularcula sp.]|nr:hypothetical protein [Parvularcula sp.]HBS36699.1 hypothetical protein [Parvularcula sp.]